MNSSAETFLVTLADGRACHTFDGGASWVEASGAAPAPRALQVVTRSGLTSLAYPRLNGATAYARLDGRPPALLGAGANGMVRFRSADDDIHWEPATMPQTGIGDVRTIAPAATARDAAWAGTDRGVLLRSVDQGRHWATTIVLPATMRCLTCSVIDA